MQIVIDIPKEIHERIKYLEPNKNSKNLLDILMLSVQNGTVFPNHGRLIDADKLEFLYKFDNLQGNQDMFIGFSLAKDKALKMPTVLEASKE